VKSTRFVSPSTEQTSLAVTIHFGDVPEELTGHPGARATSYLVADNAVSAETLTGFRTTERWFYLSRIEVMAPASAGAVVALGDSLTDGHGSTPNANERWPDFLSRRLRASPDTAQVAVINAGIGGNAVVSGGVGPRVPVRFQHDVLDQAGVRWVIVLAGVNDIGYASSDAVVTHLTDAYVDLTRSAHEAGLLEYGVTILPSGESNYDNEEHEQYRQAVNE